MSSPGQQLERLPVREARGLVAPHGTDGRGRRPDVAGAEGKVQGRPNQEVCDLPRAQNTSPPATVHRCPATRDGAGRNADGPSRDRTSEVGLQLCITLSGTRAETRALQQAETSLSPRRWWLSPTSLPSFQMCPC